MKSYTLQKVQGTPDWEKLPTASISVSPWFTVEGIDACAKACWDETGFYVRLEAREPNMLVRFTQPWEPVYTDSCLEFFVAPKEGDPRFFNFEINPNGAMLMGFGADRHNRFRMYLNEYRELFRIIPYTTPEGWGVSLYIPLSFLQILIPELTLQAGARLRGNFYKCGDETEKPHFMCWNPIESEQPDFHRPQCFGEFILG